MKNIADLVDGGFIVDNYHHEWLQSMTKQRDSAILSLAGDKAIITGVVVAADGVASSGIVTYNGKIYSFIGGEVQTTVTTKRVATDRPNASQINSAAYYEDQIEFGSGGVATFDFADLTRFYPNLPRNKEIKILGENITNAALAGSGWFLANGSNGTDNLVDRFFVVAGNEYLVGNTGGLKQVALTEAQMPSHRHGIEDGSDSNVGQGYLNSDGDNNGSGNLSGAFTKSVGGGASHENRPPYYAVVAIQFIGI